MWVGEEGRERSHVPDEGKVWAGLCSIWRVPGRVLPTPRGYRYSLATSFQFLPRGHVAFSTCASNLSLPLLFLNTFY